MQRLQFTAVLKHSFLGICTVLIGGCGGFEGPKPILDQRGPISESAKASDVGEYGVFRISYDVALTDQQAISRAGSTAATLPADPRSRNARQMAIDGTNLVRSNCAEFFRSAGDNQKWLNFSKDVTTAGGALATGVLALASPANSSTAAAVALTTATAYNGVDIYTRNFLFGSDNIESVRAMTMNALSAHRAATLPDDDKTVWTYWGAITVIQDHQELCTPASIKALVLDSISNSKIIPIKNSDNNNTASTAATNSVPAAAAAATTVAPTAAAAAAPAAAAAGPVAAAAGAAEAAKPAATADSIKAAAAGAARSIALQIITNVTPGASPSDKSNWPRRSAML